MHHLNMKIEADRRLTFEKWSVAFIDKNNLDEAGFYYIDHSDVVCCAFCVAQIGFWQEGYDVFKEHQRWSPNCKFIERSICREHSCWFFRPAYRIVCAAFKKP